MGTVGTVGPRPMTVYPARTPREGGVGLITAQRCSQRRATAAFGAARIYCGVRLLLPAARRTVRLRYLHEAHVGKPLRLHDRRGPEAVEPAREHHFRLKTRTGERERRIIAVRR